MSNLRTLIARWREDAGSTYRTWFLWEEDVRQQLRRPAFRRVAHRGLRYFPCGELERHRDSIARFGQGLKPIEAILRPAA